MGRCPNGVVRRRLSLPSHCREIREPRRTLPIQQTLYVLNIVILVGVSTRVLAMSYIPKRAHVPLTPIRPRSPSRLPGRVPIRGPQRTLPLRAPGAAASRVAGRASRLLPGLIIGATLLEWYYWGVWAPKQTGKVRIMGPWMMEGECAQSRPQAVWCSTGRPIASLCKVFVQPSESSSNNLGPDWPPLEYLNNDAKLTFGRYWRSSSSATRGHWKESWIRHPDYVAPYPPTIYIYPSPPPPPVPSEIGDPGLSGDPAGDPGVGPNPSPGRRGRWRRRINPPKNRGDITIDVGDGVITVTVRRPRPPEDRVIERKYGGKVASAVATLD